MTENIIFGQICPIGTGYFKLLVDKDKARNYKILPDLEYGVIQEDPMEENDDEQYLQQGRTPINPQTPAPYQNTPGPLTPHGQRIGGASPYLNQFTPYGGTPFHDNLFQGSTPIYQTANTKSPSSPLYNPVTSTNNNKESHYSPHSEGSNRSSPRNKIAFFSLFFLGEGEE